MKRTSGGIHTAEEIRAERKAKRFYIGLVLLLFAIQCSLLGTAISLAVGDPALAVVPDYHQAALKWDESRTASLAADKLGWDLDLEVSDVADGKGLRAIQLHATNSNGEPVSDLVIDAKVFHHASADRVDRFQLDSVGEGRYMAMPSMGRNGVWQIELSVTNASEPMTLSRTIDLKG